MDKSPLYSSVDAFIQKIENFSGEWEIISIETFDPNLCFRLWVKENYMGFLINMEGEIIAKDLKTLIWLTGIEKFTTLACVFVIFDDYDENTHKLKLRVFESQKDIPLLKSCLEFGLKLIETIFKEVNDTHTFGSREFDALMKEKMKEYFENL